MSLLYSWEPAQRACGRTWWPRRLPWWGRGRLPAPALLPPSCFTEPVSCCKRPPLQHCPVGEVVLFQWMLDGRAKKAFTNKTKLLHLQLINIIHPRSRLDSIEIRGTNFYHFDSSQCPNAMQCHSAIMLISFCGPWYKLLLPPDESPHMSYCHMPQRNEYDT